MRLIRDKLFDASHRTQKHAGTDKNTYLPAKFTGNANARLEQIQITEEAPAFLRGWHRADSGTELDCLGFPDPMTLARYTIDQHC
jgi:hypothetical protein